VTYADDLVILCRKGKAKEALRRLHEIMGRQKLTGNEEKTRICKVPEGEFDFLGYTFGRMSAARTGEARLGYRPWKRSIKHAVQLLQSGVFITCSSGSFESTSHTAHTFRFSNSDRIFRHGSRKNYQS
jgi:hypothetical protein